MSTAREAAEHLADVLERENAALLRLDLPSATALLGAKRAALAGFEQAAGEKAGDSRMDPGMRAMALRLRRASTDNKRLLERAITAQQHIMSLLAQAARKGAANGPYGARGVYVAHSTGPAFALSAQA